MEDFRKLHPNSQTQENLDSPLELEQKRLELEKLRLQQGSAASKLTAQAAVTLKRRYTKDEAPNASKKRMFFASQEENIILNSRPTNCQGPLSRRVLPILNDETLEVTAEDHEWTREFLNLMATSYSESPVIEPLTDFIQLVPTSDRHKLLRIARLFIALRLADKHLDDFYKTLVQVPDTEQYRCQ